MTSIPGRIAVLSHNHPSLNKGGAEISAYNVFDGLRKLDLDPIFVAACPTSKRSSLYLDGPNEFAVFFDEWDYSHFYQITSPNVETETVKLLDDNNISTVNFHHFVSYGMNTVGAVARSGRRTFLTLHEYSAICQHYGQMVTRPDKQLCSRASPARCGRCFPENTPQQFEQRRRWFHENLMSLDGLISPSHFLKKRFVDWGVPPEHIAVIENGLDRKDEQATGSTGRNEDDPWIFGYFGQITPFKGVNVLIEAAEALAARRQETPNIVIRVHGNLVGQSEEFVQRFNSACAQPTLEYVGPYDNEDVGDLMRACDYVVAPSLWWENSPVVIQEAYAAGRPMIASALGGLAEKVVDGKTGLQFRVGSADSLIPAMLKAASNEMWNRLRQNLPSPRDTVQTARLHLDLFTSQVRAESAA